MHFNVLTVNQRIMRKFSCGVWHVRSVSKDGNVLVYHGHILLTLTLCSTLIPTWICNYTLSKAWDVITYFISNLIWKYVLLNTEGRPSSSASDKNKIPHTFWCFFPYNGPRTFHKICSPHVSCCFGVVSLSLVGLYRLFTHILQGFSLALRIGLYAIIAILVP